jgi:hypothetical protein
LETSALGSSIVSAAVFAAALCEALVFGATARVVARPFVPLVPEAPLVPLPSELAAAASSGAEPSCPEWAWAAASAAAVFLDCPAALDLPAAADELDLSLESAGFDLLALAGLGVEAGFGALEVCLL